jgi:hypothetical protein
MFSTPGAPLPPSPSLEPDRQWLLSDKRQCITLVDDPDDGLRPTSFHAPFERVARPGLATADADVIARLESRARLRRRQPFIAVIEGALARALMRMAGGVRRPA